MKEIICLNLWFGKVFYSRGKTALSFFISFCFYTGTLKFIDPGLDGIVIKMSDLIIFGQTIAIQN